MCWGELKIPKDEDGKLRIDFTKSRIDFIKENMYKFYKTPDGEDCLEKTYYYTKYGGIFGAVFSVYEIALKSKPQTLAGAIGRFGRFTLPFAGMGLVFGTSLCLLGKFRQKTDVTNHVISGALAGAVWGVKFNSVHHGHLAAVLLGISCGWFRYFYLHNLPTFQVREDKYRTNYPNPFANLTIKVYDDPGRPVLEP